MNEQTYTHNVIIMKASLLKRMRPYKLSDFTSIPICLLLPLKFEVLQIFKNNIHFILGQEKGPYGKVTHGNKALHNYSTHSLSCF